MMHTILNIFVPLMFACTHISGFQIHTLPAVPSRLRRYYFRIHPDDVNEAGIISEHIQASRYMHNQTIYTKINVI